MVSVTTSAHSNSELIVGDFPIISSSETVLSGEDNTKTIRGALMGKVTASGKLKLITSAASDGSQNPYCVLADSVDASLADAVAPVYLTGEFDDALVTYGTGITASAVKDRCRAISIFLKTIF